MNSKKLIIIFASLFVIALVAGTFLFLYLNKDQNQVPSSNAYTIPSAQTFKVEPFPVPASGVYTSEKNGDWDFASNKEEGWIKVRNNASTTRKIGWQIDCRPDQPGGSTCWDNTANPRGELTVAPGEAWEVLVGIHCFPYQLDFTGPDFGRLMNQDTTKCNATSSPRPSPTPTRSPSPTPTRTATASPTASPSHSPNQSPSATPTRSPSPTPTRTATASPTASPTGTPPVGGPSNTPTPTPTTTPTPSPSSSATSTPAPSSSSTSTPVAESSSTPGPTTTVANASTLPQAGVNDGIMYAIIGAAALIVSAVFALMKKKYY